MLYLCRLCVCYILEGYTIHGVFFYVHRENHTADIDLTGIIIRINNNLIRLVILCAHMQDRIMCTETCQQLRTANGTVLIRQVVEYKIIRGDILRGSEHFLVLGSNLLIGRVILHIGHIRQIIGQTVLFGKLLDRRRIVFRPVFAVCAVQNGGCIHAYCHNCAVLGRVAAGIAHGVLHAEQDTVVLRIALGIAVIDEGLRQLEAVIQRIVVIIR